LLNVLYGGLLYNIRVQKHDRLQFEIKTKYDYHSKSKQVFTTDFWFYLPVSTGISASDYNAEDFYDDLRTYTRLKTPVYLLEDILTLTESPLCVILSMLDLKKKEINQKSLRREMKILGCVFRQSVNAEFGTIENEGIVLERLSTIVEFKKKWRLSVQTIDKKNFKNKTKNCMRFIDQSLSNQIELAAIYILEEFKDKELSCREQIITIIKDEIQYRIENDYPMYSDEKADFEKYLIYQSNLKKFTTSVLYLNSQPDRLTRFIRHLALGIAAGLAMTWAIIAQIYALIEYGVNLNEGMNHSLIALFTIIGIFSYILKDRIKATSGEWLSKKLTDLFHDRRFYYSMPEEKDYISIISERMKFISTDEGGEELQSRWRELEKKKLSFIIGGDVLHYNREVVLRGIVAKRCFDRFQGVVDIHRINVWRWIKTFSDPQKLISYINSNDNIEKKKVKRIYEVDLVTRFHGGKIEDWSMYKIFLNRRGIISIQEVK
jgi:hypothetical protein